MAIGIRYKDNDFDAYKKHLIEEIPKYNSAWTDFNESDPGIILVNLIARMADFLSYRRDREACEANFSTVTQRKNLAGILKLIGYKLGSVVPNNVACSLSTFVPLPEQINIPAYSEFIYKLDDGSYRYFSNLMDISLIPGMTFTSVVLHQGQPIISQYGIQNIFTGGYIYFSDEDISDSTILVTSRSTNDLYSDVKTWSLVDSLDGVAPDSLVFTFGIDKDGYNYICFNSAYLSLFDSDTLIEVAYLKSDGLSGTCKKEQVLQLISDAYTNSGETFDLSQYVSIQTLTAASGGEDAETLQHAKLYAPFSVKSMGTLVSLEDFTIKANSWGSVRKAVALDWSVADSGILLPYQVNIFCVPQKDFVVDQQFKQNYADFFRTSNSILTVEPSFFEAVYVDIEFSLNVFIRKNSKKKDLIYKELSEMIQNHFKFENLNFGEKFYYHVFIAQAISAHEDIVYVTLDGISSDISLKPYEILRLKQFSINIQEVAGK